MHPVKNGGITGATEAGNNWIGFVIHHAPGPMLAVLPTVEMATLRWVFIALALGGIAVAIWARVDDWRRGLR